MRWSTSRLRQGPFLAVTAHGDLYAWGEGWRGELGLGDDRNGAVPREFLESTNS